MAEPDTRETVVVEVGGKRVEVTVPSGLGASASAATGAGPKRRKAGGSKAGGAASGNSLVAPMQGTIVKIEVEDGQQVAEGDLVVVLEAMKMEQPLTAHRSGTIANVVAEVGATVSTGAPILDIVD